MLLKVLLTFLPKIVMTAITTMAMRGKPPHGVIDFEIERVGRADEHSGQAPGLFADCRHMNDEGQESTSL